MPTLSPQQEEAVRVASDRLRGEYPEPLTYIAGYAGTGKSTILPNILEGIGVNPTEVRFVAPTGKAAKVMRNKLAAQQYPNSIATTIHSAIYRARPMAIGTLEEELFVHQEQRQEARAQGADDKSPEVQRLTRQIDRLQKELNQLYLDDKVSFQLNVDSPVCDAKLIVVDEASMVGSNMLADLMYFNVPILAMGDPGQLPPVKDDIGICGHDPHYFLTEIHRQAADNPILYLATLARQGKPLPMGAHGDGRAVVMRRREFNDSGCFDWDAPRPQFIVGKNDTRWRNTRTLREGYLEGAWTQGPQEGEPLIVCKNTREFPNLVNGAEVKALMTEELPKGRASFMYQFEDEDEIKYETKVFQGLFEQHYRGKDGFTSSGKPMYQARKQSVELDWAYVITAHKSQGSQFEDVIVIDESSVFRDDAPKHLYTAITRAAERLTVLV